MDTSVQTPPKHTNTQTRKKFINLNLSARLLALTTISRYFLITVKYRIFSSFPRSLSFCMDSGNETAKWPLSFMIFTHSYRREKQFPGKTRVITCRFFIDIVISSNLVSKIQSIMKPISRSNHNNNNTKYIRGGYN